MVVGPSQSSIIFHALDDKSVFTLYHCVIFDLHKKKSIQSQRCNAGYCKNVLQEDFERKWMEKDVKVIVLRVCFVLFFVLLYVTDIFLSVND